MAAVPRAPRRDAERDGGGAKAAGVHRAAAYRLRDRDAVFLEALVEAEL
jgi:hypothetical protein